MANPLLLLEDEINVGSTLKDRLNLEGFEVVWSQTVADAKNQLDRRPFALAILDVNLPDGSGFDVGKVIRDRFAGTAVMFLTAAGTPNDRIHGLELGAEDYIVKPFHFKELLLRIQNVLKRIQFVTGVETSDPEVVIGKAKVRFHQYELTVNHEKHHLSHKECALLKLLYEKRGQVVSRDEILNLIWSEDEYPTPRTIDNFILRLRKWVETELDAPTVLRSIRGVGYLMERNET
ncbi:MAG: response regulator transcription factor [Bdellovibrionales bacterium]|nr:response regulator transcription factor [Oligoflexia bacterium]